MFKFFKNLFGGKPADQSQVAPEDQGAIDVADMVRAAIADANRAKVRAIFYGLNSQATVRVMNQLDAPDRQAVVAALSTR